jgi:hypothetical protein
LAGVIYDYFGGVPLQWSTTLDEWLAIPGIGPERAASLMKVLENADNKITEDFTELSEVF